MTKRGTNKAQETAKIIPVMPWPTEAPRAREEWEFRALGNTGWYDSKTFGPFEFLPEGEVAKCSLYERARHDADADFTLNLRESCPQWKAWRQYQANPNASDPAQLTKLTQDAFDALLRRYYETHRAKNAEFSLPLRDDIPLDWFYLVWPEWPLKPFLSVAPAERRRRYRICWGTNKPRSMPVIDLQDIYRAVNDLKAGKVPEHGNACRKLWGRGRDPIINADIWVSEPTAADPNGPVLELIPLLVDHSLSIKILTRLFANLLRQRRQEKGYKERGTTNLRLITKRLRSDLQKLGAARLLHSGMTARQATNMTKKITGMPLYANPGEWSVAKDAMVDFF